MAEKYCTRCGYSNDAGRGACLMCYTYLDDSGHGSVVCPNPNCSIENDQDALFCAFCGTALVEDAPSPVPGLVAAALAIIEATGGEVSDDEYEEEFDEEEMTEEERAEFEQFKAQQTDVDSAAPAQPATVADEEEDEEFAPPSALTLEESAMGPSEAAEPALSLDDAMAAPEAALTMEDTTPAEEEPEAAAEPVLSMDDSSIAAPEPEEEEEQFIPPPLAEPEATGELSEEDLAPPVPDDLPGFADEATAPAAAEPEPAEEPAPEPPTEAAEEEKEEEEAEEDALGGWSLDFGDQE